MDVLLQIGASKLLLSVVLAGVAWGVGFLRGGPRLSHVGWLLVLATLVIPSVFAVSVDSVPGWPTSVAGLGVGSPGSATLFAAGGGALAGTSVHPAARVMMGLPVLWLLGSLFVLLWSGERAWRFTRLVRDASVPAALGLQRLTDDIARRLGLGDAPAVRTTKAHVSPMVWWWGGAVQVLVPAALVAEAKGDMRWILAHELAHVRRRDHLVRWLEWLACVAFWWNPVVWWARRNLRNSGELCCDALVMETFRPSPRTYAASLVNVIHLLSAPQALCAPDFASPVHSGDRTRFIEERLRRIIGRDPARTTPRWVRTTVALAVACVLPLGLVHCRPENQATSPEQARSATLQEMELWVQEAATSVQGASLHDREAMYGTVRARITETAAAGRITGEEAARVLADVWARMEAEDRLQKTSGEAAEHGLDGLRTRSDALDPRVARARARLEGVTQEFNAAVAHGEMTEGEARAAYEQQAQRSLTETSGR